MSESVDNVNNNITTNNESTTNNSTNNSNDIKISEKIQDFQSITSNHNHVTPAGISRERSFVRITNPQNIQVSVE